MTLNFSDLFVTVKVPPPIADPTGGLLAPALAPINFIVSKIESGILSAIETEIIGLRQGLNIASQSLNIVVDDAFKNIFTIINDGVRQSTNELNGILNTATEATTSDINFAFSILDQLENILVNSVQTASAMASKIQDNVINGCNNVLVDLEKIINDATRDITQTIQTILSGSVRDASDVISKLGNNLNNLNSQISSTVRSVLNDAVTEIINVFNGASSEVKLVVENLKNTVNSGSRRMQTAFGHIDNLSVKIPDPPNIKHDLETVGNRVKSLLPSSSVFNVLLPLITLSIFCLSIYVAIKIYTLIFKPLIENKMNIKKIK